MKNIRFVKLFSAVGLLSVSSVGCQKTSGGEVESYQGNGSGVFDGRDANHPVWFVTCKAKDIKVPAAQLSADWKKTVSDVKYDEVNKTATWTERCTSEWKIINSSANHGCLEEVCVWNQPQVCGNREPNIETMVWNEEKKACELEAAATSSGSTPAATNAQTPPKPSGTSDTPPSVEIPVPPPQSKPPISTGGLNAKYKVAVKTGISGHFRKYRGTVAQNIAANGEVCILASGTELHLDDAMFVQNKYEIPSGKQVKYKSGDKIPAGKKVGDPAWAEYDQMMYVTLSEDVQSKDGKACNFKKGDRGYIFLSHFEYGSDIKAKCRADYKNVIARNGGVVFKECKE